MSTFNTKKLSSVEAETNFSSLTSQHMIVEDGGNIRRISVENKILPNVTVQDAGKIVEVDENGNYALKYKEVPLDATLIIE